MIAFLLHYILFLNHGILSSPPRLKQHLLQSIRDGDVNQFGILLQNNFISSSDVNDAFITSSWNWNRSRKIAFLDKLIDRHVLSRLSSNSLKNLLDFSCIYSISHGQYAVRNYPWILDKVPSNDLMDILSHLVHPSEFGNAWDIYMNLYKKQNVQNGILDHLAHRSNYEEWESIRSNLHIKVRLWVEIGRFNYGSFFQASTHQFFFFNV